MNYEITYDIVHHYSGNDIVFVNTVYDTVLSGGSWQQWTSTMSSPDEEGTLYNSATGGSISNWKSDSYSWKIRYIPE